MTGRLAVEDAVKTAVDVRCYGPNAAASQLEALCRADPLRFVSMVVALAAMVPVERPVDELLAWTKEVPG